MNEEVAKFKIEYNHWLSRRMKAEKFFEDNPDNLKYKYLEEFNKITKKLSLLIKYYYTLTGFEMSDNEILEGFKEVQNWN